MHMHEVICLINVQWSVAVLIGIFLALEKYSVISTDPGFAPWRSEQKAVGAPQVEPPTGCVASRPTALSHCLLCNMASASEH